MTFDAGLVLGGLRLVASLLEVSWDANDQVRLTALEVWDTRVLLHFAYDGEDAYQEMQVQPSRFSWVLSDDLGTTYQRGGGGLSSGAGVSSGTAEFRPGPPIAATVIRIQDRQGQQLAAVSLV